MAIPLSLEKKTEMFGSTKSSEEGWKIKAIKAYTQKSEFTLVDNAGFGLTAKDVRSAINLKALKNKENRISTKEIASVVIGLGISASGLWMVLAAITDPKPTSKLVLLVAEGLILAITSSLGSSRVPGITYNNSAKSFGGNEYISPYKKS